MSPRVANYFVTLRTNDLCEFSPFWQNQEYQNSQGKEKFDPDVLLRVRRAGVKRLNLIGGEPLLRADLPMILKTAKQLGFSLELTTNGILYEEQARELNDLVDQLNFFLDHPLAEEHDRSRGVECFNLVISALRAAQRAKQNPIIFFTLTRESVRFLPEMVDLAEILSVRLRLSPVEDFFGTQGFEPATVNYIKYYAKRPSVLVNLAALEFVKRGGNKVLFPRCRAQGTTLTILPDSQLVYPCFYNQNGRQGREDVCSGCMRWPYMLPSFSTEPDRYFWLNLYTNWLDTRRKKR